MLSKKMKRNAGLTSVMLGLGLMLSGCFGSDDVQPGLEQKLIRETQIIDEYLLDNQITAQVDSYSTLRFQPVSEGSGLAPYVANSVNISYTAYEMSTGDEVESGENVTIDWDDLILGLEVGLRNVREGGRMMLYVPSVLAYGETGKGDIPGNAILIYDITLNSFSAPQLRDDITAIETYLNDNSIVATQHPSGMYYIIQEEGTGNKPSWFSNVQVTYEGRLTETQEVFDTGSGVSFNLSNVIFGWQLGMQLVKQGGSITLYIPSTFAYGTQGAGNDIPPNANIEFDVELTSVF
jgi:FKBP-type peptidyl-prolyl cis-trans isomerase